MDADGETSPTDYASADKCLIHSQEGKQPVLLDSSDAQREQQSFDEKIDSRLGASVIKGSDLSQIVVSIFDDEYDPANI